MRTKLLNYTYTEMRYNSIGKTKKIFFCRYFNGLYEDKISLHEYVILLIKGIQSEKDNKILIRETAYFYENIDLLNSERMNMLFDTEHKFFTLNKELSEPITEADISLFLLSV